MTLYSYPIVIEREGKQYYAYSEDFPGVYGLGSTFEEAKESILKGMRAYITRCRKTRKPIPPTRTVYAETVTLAME
jgi:predicted RNase H-like HicB family nuclease